MCYFSKHQCDVCSKVFASKETLNNHKKCHTGAFNQCSECEKKFVCERDLDDHMNVHTGKKVYTNLWWDDAYRKKLILIAFCGKPVRLAYTIYKLLIHSKLTNSNLLKCWGLSVFNLRGHIQDSEADTKPQGMDIYRYSS